ncbi:MAG: haloacid dehalogenase-like hydrolase [Deltaproteobacteria bacterium]|nr:haloacid dehalogenase-like hydrolase [Deltaproteobacteria bacterium]
MTNAVEPLPALPPVTEAATVLAALAAVPPGGVIATDADETLWAGDVGDEVMRRAESGDPWPAGCVDFADYEHQMSGGDYQGACRWSAQVLDRAPAQQARLALLPTLARVAPRRWLFDALHAAADRGVQVWVVSASPLAVVQWAVAAHGLRATGILGIEVRDGAAVEPAPVGWGKVAAWQARGLPQPAVALGDSTWDGPLLAMASQGFLLTKASRDALCAVSADAVLRSATHGQG